MGFPRSRRAPTGTRLFFATDIHGSDQCFRKWLNAAKAYGVDAIVLGGDVTGKALSPIVQVGLSVWEGVLNERRITARTSEELTDLRRRIRTSGAYDVVLNHDECQALSDHPEIVESRLRDAALKRAEEWVELADARLADVAVYASFMLGNDDLPELAEILRSSKRVEYSEDGVLELPGHHEMISCGYSNPTPFRTPRENCEEDLAARLEALAAQISRPENAVFNLHCPPHGTLLDLAPRLDENLRPVAAAGGLEMVSIGSEAVRSIIEHYQPQVGLHGHVHESAAAQKLGTTWCINPGSEYVDGILRGALVTLTPGAEARWQMVQG
jgi:Icc-related predicted phosphoesterase